MLLTVLIPTFNRSQDLKKNLSELNKIIGESDLKDHINIIVSNNNSTDETEYVLKEYSSISKVDIEIYNQSANIGLEKNALFILAKASSEYVMYLGDDDFISYDYFKAVASKLQLDKEISCIIPAINSLWPDKSIKPYRDVSRPSRIYEPSFESCLEHSWRGHQLSGVVHLRQGLLDSYHKNKVSNIYPFIYFVAFNALRGKTWHLTDFPVNVSVVPQFKKNWDYGSDGLINDVFDNYLKLSLPYLKKVRLQVKILNVQRSRYLKGFLRSFRIGYNIFKSKNTLLLTRLIFVFLFSFNYIRDQIYRLLVSIRLLFKRSGTLNSSV